MPGQFGRCLPLSARWQLAFVKLSKFVFGGFKTTLLPVLVGSSRFGFFEKLLFFSFRSCFLPEGPFAELPSTCASSSPWRPSPSASPHRPPGSKRTFRAGRSPPSFPDERIAPALEVESSFSAVIGKSAGCIPNGKARTMPRSRRLPVMRIPMPIATRVLCCYMFLVCSACVGCE